MNDQLRYELGTAVWCQAFDWIWWPGKIIPFRNTTKKFQKHYGRKKNKIIAIVLFENKEFVEAVFNNNKIMLYNCARKMEFLENGYTLHEEEQKVFEEDVKLAEKLTGGNPNIFEHLFSKNDKFVSFTDGILFCHGVCGIEECSCQTTSKNLLKMHQDNATNKNNVLQPQTNKNLPQNNIFYCHGVCGKEWCSFKCMDSRVLKLHVMKGRENKNKLLNKTLSSEANQSVFEYQASSSSSNTIKTPKTTSTKKNPSQNEKNSQDNIIQNLEKDSINVNNQGENLILNDLASTKSETGSIKYDTLKHSQYNEVIISLDTILGDLPDLSGLKLQNVLEPVIPHPSELPLLINGFEKDIDDIKKDEPNPELEGTHALVCPVDLSVSPGPTITDKEMETDPFFQKLFERIRSNDTDGIFVVVPGAKLVPK